MAGSIGRNCKGEENVGDGWADRKAIYRSGEMRQISLIRIREKTRYNK